MMTCSNCGEQNHNARGCEKGKQPTKKQEKQPAKQRKESGRGKKRQLRRVAEDDDEDLRLRPRTISEEAFLTRLRKKQNPQEPIGIRVIGFRGDKFGVSEPTNLPIGPTGLTWNGQGAVTTNQLQKFPMKSNLAILPSMLNGFPSPRFIRANGSHRAGVVS
ncbi:hypothetical protein MTR67_042517 [Solanum verrucosum]|uniref:CCHC-type domain-containing protein n=1 Tax=Solanum verrucosum TaxID=315347 RepID=A0AAF0UMQ1_SOLVR|nr:hypothetical protein MTR67_042517 [Solanum verrucosum]